MSLLGLGERSSKWVARGLFWSRMRPTRTVRFLEGDLVSLPREVTMQTGASKPGLRRPRESLVAETKGLMIS